MCLQSAWFIVGLSSPPVLHAVASGCHIYIKGALFVCEVVHCGTLLHSGLLHTVASEAQRAQLAFKEPKMCGWHQSEWFIWGLTSPPGVTLWEVQFMGIVIEHKQYYDEKCTSCSRHY